MWNSSPNLLLTNPIRMCIVHCFQIFRINIWILEKNEMFALHPSDILIFWPDKSVAKISLLKLDLE